MSRRGGGFRRSAPDEPRIASEIQIFVEGLPTNAKIPELVQYFSSVGQIKERGTCGCAAFITTKGQRHEISVLGGA